MRSYNKAHPGKSLKVDLQLVKKQMKPADTTSSGNAAQTGQQSQQAQPKAAVNFMAPVSSVLGAEVTDKDALDAWLAKHNDDASGFYVMGDMSGDGELCLAVVDSSQNAAVTAPGPDTPTNRSDNLESSTSSRASCSTRASNEAELEIARLRAALEVSELKNKQLESLPKALQPTATPAPAPAAAPPTPATEQLPPNPALDRPSLFSVDVTPKELFRRWQESPARARLMSTGARFRTPQPVIMEEDKDDDAPSGGADGSSGGAKNKQSAAEHFARGIVAAETEKRAVKKKAEKRWTVARATWYLLGLVSRLGKWVRVIASITADHAGELSVHQLLTLALIGYAFGHHLRPIVKFALSKTAGMAVSSGMVRARAALIKAQTTVKTMLAVALARAFETVATKLLTFTSPSDTATPTNPASRTAAISAVCIACTPADLEIQEEEFNAELADLWEGTKKLIVTEESDVKPEIENEDDKNASRESHKQKSQNADNPSEPRDDDSNAMLMPMVVEHLSNAVLMATHDMSLEDDLRPALMDNGASRGTSCCRTLDGAIPGTLKREDAGSIGLGSDGATLESLGSYLYALERRGMDSHEIVLRRMKHTPSLPMAMVFSEATENKQHGYGIYWDPGHPRLLRAPDGTTLKLFMSSSELGWLKVRPITNPSEVKPLLAGLNKPSVPIADAETTLVAMNPATVRTVGMGSAPVLKGVALLRRRHCTDGHLALPITVKNLRLEGAFDDGRVTLKDVELFAKQGCGACELAKMRRRAFSLKVEPDDPTPPVLGKLWTLDVLELRVPSAHTGATYHYVAIEKVSKFGLDGYMRGYSETDVVSTINELKARIRPTHGEVHVFRMDSHPSHKSRHVRHYLIDCQQRQQLSPPFVHEGVGDPENFFLHYVPSANAMLVAAPDLGEEHFARALAYTMVARNHSVSSGSSPPRSPSMIYYNSDKFMPSHLHVFGCAGKALVHGEARDSKFDEHAKPCIYMGPAMDSDSRAHCAVWHGKMYVDVDLGCTAFDESIVLDRTRRDHPCTQPFNQVAGAKTVNVGKPTSIFDLVGAECEESELPRIQPIVWVRSMATPTAYFALLVWHGVLRPGDMASWIYELGANKIVPLPIDLCIGGQEHNTSRGVVKKALLKVAAHDSCVGAFLQPKCSAFSATRYNQPGPPVLFDIEHPDGIPDEDGELNPEVLIALADVKLVADFFRTGIDNNKVIMLEYPSSQGAGSPFAAKGRENHSTIADTSIMQTVIDLMSLEKIYTEQGAAGADTRKPTTIVVTPNGAHALRRTIGTLRVPDGEVATKSLLGKDENGAYHSRGSERYSPRFAMLLSVAFVGSVPAVMKPNGELVDPPHVEPATDDLFPTGTRVEVWWYVDKQWYQGTVIDSKVRKGKVHGLSIPRREVLVRYDADDQQLWHTLCDNSIRELVNEENEAELTLLQVLSDRERRAVPSPDDCAGWLNLLQDRTLVKLSSHELASRVAAHYMADQRVCTSFEEPQDEAIACNGKERAELQRARLVELVGDDADSIIDAQFDELKKRYSSEDWARMVSERKAWLASAPTSGVRPSLANHVGEIFLIRQYQLDLENGCAVDPLRMLTVLDDQSVVDIDYSQAHGWHVPRNEREYNISPQRDLWRTAKELKMDDYAKVDMFELVPESSVDQSKYTIHDTLWAYKIKFKEGGLVFDKLNPRWCVKGGNMDRDLYKSFAEMMRETSVAIMCGLKASFFSLLTDALLDLHDAFQGTSTVDKEGKLLPGETEFYTYQAPGFVKYGPNGERLVCRQKCYMQGRIDATAGFDGRLNGILTKSAKFKPLLWDSKVFVYHNTKYSGTAKPLNEILDEANAIVVENRDSPSQQPPLGWAIMGQHVDDMQALATGLASITDNRILCFIKGEIATTYACKLTGWHGHKLLGFDLQLNALLRTVQMSAQGTYDALRAKLLTGDTIKISPKHIVTESVYESHPGDPPAVGHPDRAPYLEKQGLIRSALGGGIWLSRAYPQITSGINAMCVDMANPSEARLAQLRHMFLYLGPTPTGKTFGGPQVSSIMHVDNEIKPFTPGMKAGYFHFFSDASINVTGGIAMFAGGCLQSISLRQHLQSPEAHTSELVAGGTNMNALVPVNGFLQEIGVRLGMPTFMYFDSKSTVFVASSDAAPKKSIWLTRRNKVITESVAHGEARPVHIPEVDMVADSNTKYIKHVVWARHMHYVLNLPGDPPPAPH